MTPETADRTAPSTLDAAGLVARLRSTFASGRTRDLAWREDQLDALIRMLTDGEDRLLEAMHQDLGRPVFEAWVADVRMVVKDVELLRAHFRGWAADERYPTPAFFRPGRSWVRYDPLGTVLVIAPWNYPVQLLVSPLAAAIAAGNTAVAKPSELAPATSAVLVDLAERYLDPEAIAFVEGGVPESTALLEQQWDHIFYTGNGNVGRIVMRAAAEHLTPVTLELGGQSPTIVAGDANLRTAVDRVASGRFANAGQTCIAPNHVFVHSSLEAEFHELMAEALRRRYGDDPSQSPHLGRIVNERHAERLAGLIDGGGYDSVSFGGQFSVADRYVAPTVLRGVRMDAPVMQEEIFGPLLPVVPFDDLDEPIAAINAGDKPLALYLFTGSDATIERVLAETSSGGVAINDSLLQVMTGEMPFGGVGASGQGAYHGRIGFETFSHRKSVYKRPSWFREPAIIRPPYKPWKVKAIRKLF